MKLKLIRMPLVFAIMAMLLLLSISSCRKKIEREYDDINTPSTSHCTDLEFNEDELGTDCGGIDCEPCTQLDAPCTLAEHTIRFYYSAFNETFEFLETSFNLVDNRHIYFAYIDEAQYEYLMLEFPTKPNLTTVYKSSLDRYSLADDEVFVKFYGYYVSDKTGEGDVYVNMEDNKFIFSSCEFSFNGFDNQWFNIKMN